VEVHYLSFDEGAVNVVFLEHNVFLETFDSEKEIGTLQLSEHHLPE
jgi:hypothetical protein